MKLGVSIVLVPKVDPHLRHSLPFAVVRRLLILVFILDLFSFPVSILVCLLWKFGHHSNNGVVSVYGLAIRRPGFTKQPSNHIKTK